MVPCNLVWPVWPKAVLDCIQPESLHQVSKKTITFQCCDDFVPDNVCFLNNAHQVILFAIDAALSYPVFMKIKEVKYVQYVD